MPLWVIFIINLLVSIALSPKPQKPKAASIEDFDVPTAEEDRPIPVLFGTKEITGPNVVWYGDLSTVSIKKGNIFGSSVIGYRYYLGMHLALCLGPVDAITRIRMAEKEAWTGSVTASTVGVLIHNADLFGGTEREGGVHGHFDVLMGEPTLPVNDYLTGVLGAPMPAFRGVCSIVWKTGGTGGTKDGYLGNTPYIKAWGVTAKRILKGWQNDDPWYPATADLGNGMNPAHIIYQAITDPEFGMGEPVGRLDDTAFRAAADRLAYEGFGLNLIWNQAGTVDEFIRIVLDHIGGALAFDRRTNKYMLTLIRGDYDEGTLPEFTESDIELTSLQRRAWGECINELTLTYTDPDTLKRTGITVQDLGNVQAQQTRIAEKIDYPGIHDHQLAREVAGRELAARSTPLARITFNANRKFWEQALNSVVKVRWPRLNLPFTVFRVMTVNIGTLEEGTVIVEAIEDIYALSVAVYLTTQPADAVVPPVVTPDQPIGTPNILGASTVAPPSAPADGDRYLVPLDVETGSDWFGHAGQVAEWDEGAGAWIFVDVPIGVIIYNQGTDQHIVTDGQGTVTPIVFNGQPGVPVGATGAYAVDRGYLWFVKTNEGTEITHNAGNVAGWIFERRIRGHAVVVNILLTNPFSVGPGATSWQLHWWNALTGERIGSTNHGGQLVDTWHDGLGARYFYTVGDEAGMSGQTPTARKIDTRQVLLGNVIAGVTAAKYTKASVIAFLGIAKIGSIVYISVQQTLASEHRIYRLNADTMALLDDTWVYSGANRPGKLVVNPYGAAGAGPAELWAIAADGNFGSAGSGGSFNPLPQAFIDGSWYGRNGSLVDTAPIVQSDDASGWAVVFDPAGATLTTPGLQSLAKDSVGRFHAVRGSQIGRSNTTVLLDAWTWGTPGGGNGRSYQQLRQLNGTLYAISSGAPGVLHPRVLQFSTGTGLWSLDGEQAGLEDFVVVEVIYQPTPHARFLIFGYLYDDTSSPPDVFFIPRVYETTDLGSAWSLVAELLPSNYDSALLTAVAVNGDDIGVSMRGTLAGGAEEAVLGVSSDGGDSWIFPVISWPVTSPVLGLTGICWDGAQYLAAGRNWIGRSSDLLSWAFELDLFDLIGGAAPAVSQFQPDGLGNAVVFLSAAGGSSGGYTLQGSDSGIVWGNIFQSPDTGGVAWRINLTTGAIEGVFQSPYVAATDAEFVYNFQGDHPELWIAYSFWLSQTPRVARHRRSDGAIIGELNGDDANVFSGSSVQLTLDGSLISYGKDAPPAVYDISNLQTANPLPKLRAEYDAEVPGFFNPPFQMALDRVDDHPDPDLIDGTETYVGIYDERSGFIYRIPLSAVLGGGAGGSGGTGGAQKGSGARVSRSTDQAIGASSLTAIDFDTEPTDTDGYFVGSEPSRLSVDRSGLYLVTACVQWDASTTGTRRISLRANASEVFAATQNDAEDSLTQTVAGLVELAIGEYVELLVLSDSAVDVKSGAGVPVLTISRVGPQAVPALPRGATWARGATALTTDVNPVDVKFPKAARIFGVTVTGGPTSGTCVIDIRKTSIALYPAAPGDSIVGSSPPTITSGQTYEDTALVGWDIDVAAGDVLTFVLSSVSTFRRVQIFLHIEEFE